MHHHVLAYPNIMEAHQIVNPNVSVITNVQISRHVSIENAEILVQDHVELMQNAEQSVIFPYVHVPMVSLVIHFPNVILNNVGFTFTYEHRGFYK